MLRILKNIKQMQTIQITFFDSGGRVVAGSNPVIPTLKINELSKYLARFYFISTTNLQRFRSQVDFPVGKYSKKLFL